MLRTILFDLGNVIVHFSHELMCAQMGEVLGLSGKQVRNRMIETGLMARFEKGQLTDEELVAGLSEGLNRTVTVNDLRRACSDIFTLNEPIVPLIQSLKRQGFRLVLLSNTSHWHVKWVREHWPVLDHFDHLVLSYEVGAIKPEPAIFDAALNAIGCPPEQCFYTDDIAAYIDAAREFGLQAEVFTDAASMVRHLQDRGVTID